MGLGGGLCTRLYISGMSNGCLGVLEYAHKPMLTMIIFPVFEDTEEGVKGHPDLSFNVPSGGHSIDTHFQQG